MKSAEIRQQILDLIKHYQAARTEEKEPFLPGVSMIHYGGRVFDEEELIHLVDASLDFWLTAGPWNQRFSSGLQEYLGVSRAIPTNSGSSANLLAISALTSDKLKDRALRPGDEIITVAAGFPATVAPIVQNRCIPVFVDIEAASSNINAQLVEAAISSRSKAIFLAHTLGNPFDLDDIVDLCRRHKLWLVEDNCDALGSRYRGQLTATFGDLGTLSFYPAHHITTGEGGAVVTNNEELARIVLSFRDWGRDCHCEGGKSNSCGQRFSGQYGNLPFGYDHKYVYSHIGYNLKMTEMQAAIGCAQLKKIDSFIAARKVNYRHLYEGLKPYGEYLQLFEATPKSDPAWFAFVITLKENCPFTRNDVTGWLEKNKIETRNLFSGNLLCHPAFMKIEHRISGDLTVTDSAMHNSFFIGVYPGLTAEMIEYILENFREFFRQVN